MLIKVIVIGSDGEWFLGCVVNFLVVVIFEWINLVNECLVGLL